MGIIESIATRLGYTRKTAMVASAPDFLLADAAMQRWSVPDGSIYHNQADLYRRLSWVQIAVSAVARTAAVVPFSVQRRVGEDLRDIPNHPFEVLLSRPNPLDSRFELLESTFSYHRVTGNSYWWLNRRDANSAPVEIWPIPPYQMRPIPDGRLYLKGYAFSPEGFYGNTWQERPMFLLEPWEVVHFKTFNPLSRFVGLSPIEALAIDAAADLKMQEWNGNFFGEDNAKLPGMLAFADPIPDPDWTKIQADIKAQTGGVRRQLMMIRNAGKGGVSWLQMSLSQKEMAFLESRHFNKEEIFAMFAPGLSSVLDVNATEANASAGKGTFIEQSVWPALMAAGEKVTNDALPAYGRNLMGAFNDIRVKDRELLLQEQQQAEHALSIDEIREKYYKLGPLPPGKQVAAAEIASASSATLASGGQVIEGELIEEVVPRLPAALPMKRGPVGEDLSDDERALYNVLLPILTQYGEEIRDRIEAGLPIVYDELSAALRLALVGAVMAAALESLQAAAAEAEVDVEPDEVVTRASAWAERYAGNLVVGLEETTRKAVATAQATYARTPGMTREQLEALLAPALGARRAEVVAITETTRAAAAGVNELKQLLDEREIAMERVWRTAADEKTCPTCRPLNGRPESEWPEDLLGGPPAHPRCRCSQTLRRKQ
jgi:phage portal protein BeeE